MSSPSIFSNYFPSESDEFAFRYPIGISVNLVKRKHNTDNVMLACKSHYDGFKRTDPFFDSERIGRLAVLEERESGRVSPGFFTGEIGERVMRSTIECFLDHAYINDPDFFYETVIGKPKTTAMDSDGLRLAYGPIGNVLIYRLLTKTLDNGHIIPYTEPASVLGEIDTLMTYSYGEDEKGVLVCESKTSRVVPDRICETALQKQLVHIKEFYPKHRITYLLMAPKGDLASRSNPKKYRGQIIKCQQTLRDNGFESMYWPFFVEKSEMKACGEYMARVLQSEIISSFSVRGRQYGESRIKLFSKQGPTDLNRLDPKRPIDEKEILRLYRHGQLWRKRPE